MQPTAQYYRMGARTALIAACNDIGARYEVAPRLACRLPAHNTRHTLAVYTAAVSIACAARLSDKDVWLSAMAAAGHDTWQDWDYVPVPGSWFAKRARKSGENELKSANDVRLWSSTWPSTFSLADCQVAHDAIFEGTVATKDLSNKTVYQPRLLADSHPVTRVVALADLGAAGMNPARFLEDGINLFLEDYPFLIEDPRFLDSPKDFTKYVQGKPSIHEVFVAWMAAQPDFARGRKARFEEEAGPFGDTFFNVAELFSHFNESVERAELRAKEVLDPERARALLIPYRNEVYSWTPVVH